MAAPPDPRNPRFRAALWDVVHQVCNIFKAKAPPEVSERVEPIPSSLRSVVLFHDNKKALKGTEEWASLERVATEDPEISKHLDNLVGFEAAASHLDLEQIVVKLTSCSFDADPTNVPDELAFRQAYSSLETLLFSPTFEIRFTAPLIGLTGPIAKIELAPNSTLELIDIQSSHARGRELFPDGWATSFIDSLTTGLTAFLSIDRVATKVIGGHVGPPVKRTVWSEVETTISQIRESLAVLGPGRVTVPFIAEKCIGWNVLRGVSYKSHDDSGAFQSGGQRLNADDLERLPRIAALVREAHSVRSKPLRIALRWFTKGAHERDSEDRLIDFMIAAEAFFLSDCDQGELRHRISQRAAVYLEDTLDGRRRLKKLMLMLYDARSKLVHGGTLLEKYKFPVLDSELSSEITSRELVLRTQNLMRRALQKALGTPRVDCPVDTPELWDSLILAP